MNFPISFKSKVAIAELFWKMQRKTWYSILALDTMPLSLKNLLLIFSLKFISGMNSIVLYLGHYVAWNTGPFNYISGNEAYILGHILYGPSMKNERVKIDPFFLI